MKKNTRRLLTITLAVCMGLLLSAGIVSATITTTDDKELQQSDTLLPETMVKSDAANGMEVTYMFSDEDIYTDTASNDQSVDLIPDIGLDHQGYTVTEWIVESITNAADADAKDILKLKLSKKTPIQYTIEYYDSDQKTLLYKDENITVENVNQYMSRTAIKDGYVLDHWYIPASNGEFHPDLPITTLFLTAEGHSNNGYVIKFYAVWEKPAAPAPEPKLDDSPRAGDRTPVSILMLLMTITAVAAGITSCRRRSA